MTFNTVLKPTSTASIIGGGFKPCYKWMTFNTNVNILISSFCSFFLVLNLVINGWPSIPCVTLSYIIHR